MKYDLHHVLDHVRPQLKDLLVNLQTEARILIVVDEEISLGPGVSAFGIERVIQLLRGAQSGALHFTVDVARRTSDGFSVIESPAGAGARYVGFRFDSTLPGGQRVIDRYHEIWCFGFKPHAAGSFPSNDSEIGHPSSLPASDDELAVLTTWMNEGGGLFGTGDHDFLGSPMCGRIPRLGTMRAWTNAQAVPPIGGPGRLDTNRPFTEPEKVGAAVIPSSREEDSLPQPIEWVPWSWWHHPWIRWISSMRPHPVLCHPTLGPIDVMPDHPHEGVVFDHVAQPDVGIGPITLSGSHSFPGVSGEDYPTVGGLRPLPMVIARGRTLSTPPLQHDKGPIPAKRFGMISVYDGHPIGLGRVATDSTWHHWMNMNISQIESAGGADWQKIRQYYINLGVWLAPPGIMSRLLQFHLVESFYSYPGVEELGTRLHTLHMGQVLRKRLVSVVGPCWVTQTTLDLILRVDLSLYRRVLEHYFAVPLGKRPSPPRPPACLSCPPFEMFELAVLGGMGRKLAETVVADGLGGRELERAKSKKWNADKVDRSLLEGASQGLAELSAELRKSFTQARRLLG